MKITKIQPFDILLYEKKIFGKVLYYHCAWFIGIIWKMRVNFESTSRGPEFEEWKEGRIPTYVCRYKVHLSDEQKDTIMEECNKLKDTGYDWRAFLGHWFGWDNPKLTRCDELIEIPCIAAGIDTMRPERRPRGYLRSKAFNHYKVTV